MDIVRSAILHFSNAFSTIRALLLAEKLQGDGSWFVHSLQNYCSGQVLSDVVMSGIGAQPGHVLTYYFYKMSLMDVIHLVVSLARIAMKLS